MAHTTIQQIFTPRFAFQGTSIDDGEGLIPNKLLWHKTKRITQGEATMTEIYEFCKNELEILKEKYRNYLTNGEPTNCYSFSLKTIGELDPRTQDLIVERIYYVELDEDYKITREEKFFLQENLTILPPYNICIVVGLYVCPDLSEMENDEDIPPKELKRAVKEDECVVCVTNKPNVLYGNCGHLSTCKDCEKMGKFKSCPICRAEVTTKFIFEFN